MAGALRLTGRAKAAYTTPLSEIRSVRDRQKKSILLRQLVKNIKTETKPISNLDYCVNLVRRYDFENYLCVLLYPVSIRTSAMVIHALNVELARVADSVSDKQTGIMRMQFWKDSIEKVYKGDPPQSPITLELARAIEKHQLTKHWFLRIIEARAWEMGIASVQTMKESLEYGENTNSSMFYLLLESLGIKDVQVDHAASHLGKAKSLVTLLRGLPHNAMNRRMMIPQEILIKHSVSVEKILRGKQDQPVLDVFYDISCEAKKHLDLARSLKGNVPKSALPIFLNSVICDNYLTNIQKANFNVFDPKLRQKNALLPLQLFIQKIKRTY